MQTRDHQRMKLKLNPIQLDLPAPPLPRPDQDLVDKKLFAQEFGWQYYRFFQGLTK